MSSKRPRRAAFRNAASKLQAIRESITPTTEDEHADSASTTNSDEEQQRQHKTKRKRATSARAATKTPKSDKQSMPDKWQQFVEQNYAKNADVCYGKAIPNYESPVEPIPQSAWQQSMQCQHACAKADTKQQFNPHDTVIWWKEAFTFTGAPIKQLAWVPLPFELEQQFVLLAIREPVDEFTHYHVSAPRRARLLLYSVRMQRELSGVDLHYAISIANGPVHCLEFLPSGGYCAQLKRLALLAVGTANSCIEIYALPISVQWSGKEGTFHCQAQLQPVWCLSVSRNQMSHTLASTHCQQLIWSRFQAHAHIFSGHANGCIGIWQMPACEDTPEPNLLNYFYVGQRSITALALHYATNGPRWLVVSCLSRRLLLYDIRDMSCPTQLCCDLSRSIVTSIEWPPTWHCMLISFGDLLPCNGCCITAVKPLCAGRKNEKLLREQCGITHAHYNPWLNALIYGNTAGQVKLLPQIDQLTRKNVKRRTLQMPMYSVTVSDLNARATVNFERYVPEQYSSYQECYGLLFDTTLSSDKIQSENLPPEPHLRRHFTRFNCLANNLNFHGRQMLAIGYEMGMLRIVRLPEKCL